MNPIGCNSDQLKDIMIFCGYEAITLVDEKKLFFISNKNKKTQKITNKNKGKKINKRNTKNIIKKDPNSPFAVLEKLL